MNSRLYHFVVAPAGALALAGILAFGGCSRPASEGEGEGEGTYGSEQSRGSGQLGSRGTTESEAYPRSGSSSYAPGSTGTGAQEGAQARSSQSQGSQSQGSQSQGSQAQSGREANEATAAVQPVAGSQLSGTFEFRQEDEGVRVTSNLRGLPSGEHQVHIASAASCPAASQQRQGQGSQQQGQEGSQGMSSQSQGQGSQGLSSQGQSARSGQQGQSGQSGQASQQGQLSSQQMHTSIGSIEGEAGEDIVHDQWTVRDVSLKGPNSVVGRSVLILGSAAGAGASEGQQGQQQRVLACGVIQPAGSLSGS